MSRAEFEAAQPQVDPEVLPRVDNGDGTWSYLPSLDLPPDFTVQGEVIRWRYDGQARFSYQPEPRSGMLFRIVPDPDAIEPPEELLRRTERIDRWGHRWSAEGADPQAWALAVEAEEPEPEGAGEVNTEPAEDGPHAAPGTVEWWEPHSWSSNDCAGDRKKEERLWDGDSRTVVGTPDEWESTAVSVQVGRDVCTGVILT
ncbi:MAG: hypothetical protein AAFY88_02375, partial [Acidobacteriota bacterium]